MTQQTFWNRLSASSVLYNQSVGSVAWGQECDSKAFDFYQILDFVSIFKIILIKFQIQNQFFSTFLFVRSFRRVSRIPTRIKDLDYPYETSGQEQR